MNSEDYTAVKIWAHLLFMAEQGLSHREDANIMSSLIDRKCSLLALSNHSVKN